MIKTEGQIIQRDINTSAENTDIIPDEKIDQLIQEFISLSEKRIVDKVDWRGWPYGRNYNSKEY